MIAIHFDSSKKYCVYTDYHSKWILIPGSIKKFYILIEIKDSIPENISTDITKGLYVIDGVLYSGYFSNLIPEIHKIVRKSPLEQLSLF